MITVFAKLSLAKCSAHSNKYLLTERMNLRELRDLLKSLSFGKHRFRNCYLLDLLQILYWAYWKYKAEAAILKP